MDPRIIKSQRRQKEGRQASLKILKKMAISTKTKVESITMRAGKVFFGIRRDKRKKE